MKITRLVELSIRYKIQDRLSRTKTNDIAKANADFTSYTLKYNNIQTNYPVAIKVNDSIVSSGYTVDYINGIVKFTTPLLSSDTVKADYSFCTVNLYDEGSSPTNDNFKYPAIAVYTDGDDRKPYEIGSSKKEIEARWIISVMTEKGGERQDITDEIMDIFDEEIPIIDYNQGFPVNRDGTKNEAFNEESQVLGYMICESINSEKGGSLDIGDTPKFMADIFVDLKINI